MLKYGNREFRNLQEQVEKNQKDIETLKSGIKISFWVLFSQLSQILTEENVGKYAIVEKDDNKQYLYVITKRANGGLIADDLGEYPAVVKGPQGEAGENGEQGPKGNSVYGVGTTLPDASGYQIGDFYLLANGNLYKNVGNEWILQCSIKGPQGLQGSSGSVVIANPSDSPTDVVLKIKIDGVVYRINSFTDEEKELVDKLIETIEIDQSGNVTFGASVTVDGSILGGSLSVDDDVEAATITATGNVISGGKVSATGNVETSGIVVSDAITSKHENAGQHIDLAAFSTSDDHWHMTNTKVDDTLQIDGELELGSGGDLGSNIISAIKSNALPTIASGDAGKVLTVNAGETGAEWATAGGGGGKYAHFISLRAINPYLTSEQIYTTLVIINEDSTAYTNISGVANWLYSNGYRGPVLNIFRTFMNTNFASIRTQTDRPIIGYMEGIYSSNNSNVYSNFTLSVWSIDSNDVLVANNMSYSNQFMYFDGDKVINL